MCHASRPFGPRRRSLDRAFPSTLRGARRRGDTDRQGSELGWTWTCGTVLDPTPSFRGRAAEPGPEGVRRNDGQGQHGVCAFKQKPYRVNPSSEPFTEEACIRDLTTDPAFFALLAGSHARLVGRPLLPEGADAAWAYARAPFALLAHDAGPDPCFVYANRAAQESFGYSLDEMIGMPSRLSAEAPDRAARERLLAAVARDGFVTGYSGLRIAKSGRRFAIRDVVVWQLIDEAGVAHGQAATYRLPEDGAPLSGA